MRCLCKASIFNCLNKSVEIFAEVVSTVSVRSDV